MRRHFFVLALGLAAAVPLSASAGTHVGVSIAVPGLAIQVGNPGFGIAIGAPAYVGPAPAYYAPAPVTYYESPVYYAPPVRYVAPIRYVAPRPVVVAPRYGYHEGHRHPGGWDRSPGHGNGHWR
jgi:hypothetical protein